MTDPNKDTTTPPTTATTTPPVIHVIPTTPTVVTAVSTPVVTTTAPSVQIPPVLSGPPPPKTRKDEFTPHGGSRTPSPVVSEGSRPSTPLDMPPPTQTPPRSRHPSDTGSRRSSADITEEEKLRIWREKQMKDEARFKEQERQARIELEERMRRKELERQEERERIEQMTYATPPQTPEEPMGAYGGARPRERKESRQKFQTVLTDGTHAEIYLDDLGPSAIGLMTTMAQMDKEMAVLVKQIPEAEAKKLDLPLALCYADLTPEAWEKQFPAPFIKTVGHGARAKHYLDEQKKTKLEGPALRLRQLQLEKWTLQLKLQRLMHSWYRRKEASQKKDIVTQLMAKLEPSKESVATNPQGTGAAVADAEEREITNYDNFVENLLASTAEGMDESATIWKNTIMDRIEKEKKKHKADAIVMAGLEKLERQVEKMPVDGWIMKKKITTEMKTSFKNAFLAEVKKAEESSTYLDVIRTIVIRIMEGALDFMTINDEPYSKKVYQAAYNEAFKNKDEGEVDLEELTTRKSNDLRILSQWEDYCRKKIHPLLKDNPKTEEIWQLVNKFPWKTQSGVYGLAMILENKSDCDHVETVLYRFHKAYLLPMNLRALDIRGVWGAMKGDVLATLYSRQDMFLPYIAIATSVQQIGNMSRTANNLTNLYAGVYAKVGGKWIQVSAHMLITALNPDEVSDYNTVNVALTWFARFTDQSSWGNAGVPLTPENVLDIPQDHIETLVSRLPLAGDQRSRAQKKFNEQRDAWVKAVRAHEVTAKAVAATVVQTVHKMLREKT